MFVAYHPYHSNGLLLEGVSCGGLSQIANPQFTYGK